MKQEIKCPVCGGPPNKMFLDTVNYAKGIAYFIIECWSGDTSKPSQYHWFLAKIHLQGDIEISLFESLKQRDIEAEIHANPKQFAWLGKSERRHIDFGNGFEYAVGEISDYLGKRLSDVVTKLESETKP